MSESFSKTPESMEPALGHMDALPVGTMLGEFELQGLLGVGGFGMVYRGYDHSLHRPVAIKEYMPSSLVGRAADLQISVKSSSDDQSFRAGLTSFIAEARLLARFDHPSLVKVYRFWEANNTAYMAMPLYQGITLKQARLQMSGPPPEVWLRTVLWSVVEALKVLHDNGTIHRDVSPDNIFLQDSGPPVLLDLGAARRAVLDRDHKHTAVLKVNYAPIEQYAQAKGMQEGPWTDLYALGAVVHGCLCNEAPLPATIRVVRDRMPSFFRVAQTVYTHFGTRYSPIFVDAIAHTLVIEPAHRTQSVLDFCEEMQLQVPEDLARFDWRSELGDSITLGDESLDLLVPAKDPQTMEKTLEQPHVPVVSIPRRPSHPRRRRNAKSLQADLESKSESLPKPQYLMWWVMLFSAAVAVALGVAGWMHAEKSNQALPLSSQAMTPNTPPAASEYTLPPPAEVVSASTVEATTPLLQAAPVASAAPVALEVSEPVSKPERRIELIRNSSKTVPSATPKAAKKEKSAPSPMAAPAASPSLAEQRPTPVEAPGAPVKPVELCADATLLSRTMCIYQYCQKREFASLPVCVEDRKRWESRDRNPSQ